MRKFILLGIFGVLAVFTITFNPINKVWADVASLSQISGLKSSDIDTLYRGATNQGVNWQQFVYEVAGAVNWQSLGYVKNTINWNTLYIGN